MVEKSDVLVVDALAGDSSTGWESVVGAQSYEMLVSITFSAFVILFLI